MFVLNIYLINICLPKVAKIKTAADEVIFKNQLLIGDKKNFLNCVCQKKAEDQR